MRNAHATRATRAASGHSAHHSRSFGHPSSERRVKASRSLPGEPANDGAEFARELRLAMVDALRDILRDEGR